MHTNVSDQKKKKKNPHMTNKIPAVLTNIIVIEFILSMIHSFKKLSPFQEASFIKKDEIINMIITVKICHFNK